LGAGFTEGPLGDSPPQAGSFLLHNRHLFGFDLKHLPHLPRNLAGVLG
jgi:hypothetical protein